MQSFFFFRVPIRVRSFNRDRVILCVRFACENVNPSTTVLTTTFVKYFTYQAIYFVLQPDNATDGNVRATLAVIM